MKCLGVPVGRAVGLIVLIIYNTVFTFYDVSTVH